MSTFRTLSALLVLLAVACSRSSQPTSEPVASAAASIERTEVSTEITSGTPVTFADLKIDGMTCAQMCGGSIKKALTALPGVASTEIKFDSPDGDHAVVTYDPASVNDAQLIEAIQALHEGQYKVMAVTITKQVKVEGGSADGNEAEATVTTEVQAAAATAAEAVSVIPGILEMLSAIVRR
jgi:copper chaperone CopZ